MLTKEYKLLISEIGNYGYDVMPQIAGEWLVYSSWYKQLSQNRYSEMSVVNVINFVTDEEKQITHVARVTESGTVNAVSINGVLYVVFPDADSNLQMDVIGEAVVDPPPPPGEFVNIKMPRITALEIIKILQEATRA